MFSVPMMLAGTLLAGVVTGGIYFDEKGGADMAKQSSKLARWLVIGGGLYVAYEVARKAGYAK